MPLQLVAHRGVTEHAPENTLAAFQRALELGADAVELDVRLSADGVPVVYHYAYLEAVTTGQGPIWDRSLAELRALRVGGPDGERIPTLTEALETFAGRLGLEIELKGPEPEAVAAVAPLLESVRTHWGRIEVTSYEPMLLAELRRRCSDLSTALLFPRSESWMKLDFVAYAACHRARQAQAAAVHLHPSQLSEEVVNSIRAAGVDVHAWEVNDTRAFELVTQLDLPWANTDQLESALRWRTEKRT
ncbi:MAG: glycerophosphodiester phosphodiesterase [Chloroflexota bacterium]|nr:glycerophosphodiester phosphodiesterase [Chloroflexota bacterium]